MKFITKVGLLALLWIIGSVNELQASHAMGADLTYTCLGGNQYQVNLSFYRDCAGITPSTSISVSVSSASCGQSLFATLNLLPAYPIEVSPLCSSQLPNSTCNGGALPGVQQYIFQGTITLPTACNDWVFSFLECCRNSSITTLSSPGSENLYVEATLDNLTAPCNSSPNFTTLPVPYICQGQPYVYNHGAVDPDGDSLVYTLLDALTSAGLPVAYNGGFSGTSPMSSVPPVAINSANGNLSITPSSIQIAVVAVRVDEYRNGVLIGSTIRDIQVTVLSCSNNAPTVQPIAGLVGGTQIGPYSVEVCPGNPIAFNIPGTDPDALDFLNMTWNNGIPGATFTPSSGTTPVSSSFSWTPGPGDVGLHSLTITLEDDGCPVLGQQTIAIDIRVLDGTYAGPDLAYCTPGGPAMLNATGGSSFTWNILSGSAGSLSCTSCPNPMATPGVPTTYEVVSNLPGACKNRDTVVVTPQTGFTLAGLPDITLCGSGTTPLQVTPSVGGAYTYSWTPAFTLTGANTQTPFATPAVTTNYVATVTSSVGCVARDTVQVIVAPDVLNLNPTAVPPQSCSGAPVALDANVAGNCNLYTVSSIAYAPLSGAGTTVVLNDDDVSAAIPLGFNFDFFCNTFSEIYLAANGFVTFNPASGGGCCSGTALPTATISDFIAGTWNDLYPAGNGSVSYFTVGTTPNRRFVIDYNGIPHCCGATPDNSFQIILFETSDAIEIHSTVITDDGSTHTQGIQSGAGPDFFVVPGRSGTNFTASNDAFRFDKVPPPAFTVTWSSPLGTPIGSGPSISQTPGSATTYYATVTDGVCTETDSIVVEVANVDAGVDQFICPGDNAPLNAVYSGPPPPNNCNVYTVSSIPFSPVAGVGTPIVLADDELSPAISIGFPFVFYCNSFTQLYVSSNGMISFDPAAGSGCCSGQFLPDPFTPNNLIAAAWSDLYPPGNGSVNTFITGVSPNRRFVINYTNIPFCCGATSDVTTQVILYETTNVIEIHNTLINNIFSGTQGIEDATGANAVVVAGRNSANWTATNDAFRFSPQVNTISYNWSPPIYLSSTTVSNPTANTVLTTVTYTVTVDNGTCIMTDDVLVDVSCLLPVSELELFAEKLDNQAKLEWITVGEEGLASLILEEQSLTGSWSELAQQEASGEPGKETSYQAWDAQLHGGRNVYRVKAVNVDGSFRYSNLAEVQVDAPMVALVSPNPGAGLFQFELEGMPESPVLLRVMDMRGKIMREERIALDTPGAGSFSVNIQAFADGVYLYEILSGGNTLKGKLIKQR